MTVVITEEMIAQAGTALELEAIQLQLAVQSQAATKRLSQITIDTTSSDYETRLKATSEITEARRHIVHLSSLSQKILIRRAELARL